VFVIGASVALAWCFKDEATAFADAVLTRLEVEHAMAPAIWPLEVANGLRSAERRGRIDERELPAMAKLLLALPIRIDEIPLSAALGDVLQLARALGLSTYDACYVALALRHAVPLATLDDALARAATAAGAELLD
jgi:predicted nucleic acid-binding protein